MSSSHNSAGIVCSESECLLLKVRMYFKIWMFSRFLELFLKIFNLILSFCWKIKLTFLCICIVKILLQDFRGPSFIWGEWSVVDPELSTSFMAFDAWPLEYNKKSFYRYNSRFWNHVFQNYMRENVPEGLNSKLFFIDKTLGKKLDFVPSVGILIVRKWATKFSNFDAF